MPNHEPPPPPQNEQSENAAEQKPDAEQKTDAETLETAGELTMISFLANAIATILLIGAFLYNAALGGWFGWKIYAFILPIIAIAAGLIVLVN